MAELREVVLVDFVRTPFGRASKKKPGFFTNVRSDDLGNAALTAMMKRTKVDPAQVDDLIIDNARGAGPGREEHDDLGGFPF
jgi:acetyl-CoA acetyltransferase